MDHQDREFEGFLRRFKLRKPTPFLEETTDTVPQKRKTYWWVLSGTAVAAAAILLSVSMFPRFVPVKTPAPVAQVTPAPVPDRPEEKGATGNLAQPVDGVAPTPSGEEGASGKEPSVLAESRRLEKVSPTRVVVVPEGQSESAPPRQEQPSDPPPPTQPEQPPAAPRPSRKKGSPGEQIVNRACGLCHSLDLIPSHYDSRDAYEALVTRQIGYGAPVQENEIPVLVDYLWKTYGVGEKQN